MTTEIVKLESGKHRLQLVPKMGGGIADWDWKSAHGWTPLLRPWDGVSDDPYMLACFPLVPWANRITQGGFEHEGIFYPVRRNRVGETYPIHGDGWLQPWHMLEYTKDSVRLSLESHAFAGNPHEYVSTQNFRLLPDRLIIELTVSNLGTASLPFGLGLHPCFLYNSLTRLRSKVSGVWLSGPDGIPISYSDTLPSGWDYREPVALEGPLIDNCFDGWDGEAVIEYPDRSLTLTMSMQDCKGYVLMYRPPERDYFCLDPITHPIDAFHMPDKPGLVPLATGQSLSLTCTFRVSE